MNKIKNEKLESNIKKELTLILRNKIRNEFCKSLIITEVRLNNDSSVATIFYSSLKSKDIQLLTENIDLAKKRIRYELAQKLTTYKLPELKFEYDKTLDAVQRINEILSKINEPKS